MKKIIRIIATSLLLCFVLSFVMACTPIQPSHQCNHICSECGLCTDMSCDDPACSAKCQGHDDPHEQHVCQHICGECGLCTDLECKDPACANKCQGHVAPHVCQHICGECGLCTDLTCTDPACANKCQGHVPPHVCKHVCGECGLCTDLTCTDPACANKCQGHVAPHVCKHVCGECGLCTDLSCNDPACANKCKGHVPPHVCKHVCGECGLCTDLECKDPACANKCKGHIPPHVCQHICGECGLCTDLSCNDPACANKCQGHSTTPELCAHACPVCGKCTSATSTDALCSGKCGYTYEYHAPTQIPQIRITTNKANTFDFATKPTKNTKDSISYEACKVTVTNCDSKYALTDIAASVKARGNYTLNYAKKPFRIKFDKKQTMLGMNDGYKAKNWVLLADYKDNSALRNNAAFYLGKQILGSDGYYCSDFINVELYINDVYWGRYTLAEQQEIKDGRVAINEAEDNYTGVDIGYLLEFDGYYTEEVAMEQFAINYTNNGRLNTKTGTTTVSQKGYTIKSDVYNQAQHDFIKNYMQNLYQICYDAIYNNKFTTFNSDFTQIVSSSYTNVYDTVSAIIDIDSLVDTYIIQEFACDNDISWSSFYMDVDMSANGDKLLRFEAPWDFDSAFGLKDTPDGKRWYAATSQNPWLIIFSRQDWFWEKVQAKWNEAKAHGVFDKLLAMIDDFQVKYRDAYDKNDGKRIGTNGGGWGFNIDFELCQQARQAKNQTQAAEYLRTWIVNRIEFLDSQFNGSTPSQPSTLKIPEGSTAYRFEAENATISGSVTKKTGYNASGNGYLGNVSGGMNNSFTFTVNATSATEVLLALGASYRDADTQFSQWFSISVNGVAVTLPEVTVPACTSGDSWHDWHAINCAMVTLKQGVNTITFTASNNSTNVDFLDIYSKVVLR